MAHLTYFVRRKQVKTTQAIEVVEQTIANTAGEAERNVLNMFSDWMIANDASVDKFPRHNQIDVEKGIGNIAEPEKGMWHWTVTFPAVVTTYKEGV